jgi:hypothetical protein
MTATDFEWELDAAAEAMASPASPPPPPPGAYQTTPQLMRGNLGERLATEALAALGHQILMYKPDITGTNRPGIDTVTFHNGQVWLVDNKAFSRGGNIRRVSSLTRNLNRNIATVNAQLAAMASDANRTAAERQVARQALAQLRAGNYIRAVTNANVARQSNVPKGVDSRLQKQGIRFVDVFRSAAQPAPPMSFRARTPTRRRARLQREAELILTRQLESAASEIGSEPGLFRRPSGTSAFSPFMRDFDLEQELQTAYRSIAAAESSPLPEFELPRVTGPIISGCAYFFKGAGYVRYDIATNLVNVGPVEISRFWTRLPAEFQNDIDAAVNSGNGHVYFFKGGGYVRYNIATDMVDVGPVAISRFWNLPPEFQTNIDAAVSWNTDHVYLFKGAGYVRYNMVTNMVDVGPVAISRFWNLPPEFQNNLDAALNWHDGHVYFFKGAGYVRYNLKTDFVDVGPVEISRFWNLPPSFQKNIGAAVNWTFPCNLAGLFRAAAGLPVNEVANWPTRSRPGSFNPIGIMMHHTVETGPGSLTSVIKGRTSPTKLEGPLANFHVQRDGVLNIVSGGRANHAGTGAQQVLDEVNAGIAPSDTAARRRLPNGPGGNAFFYGFENENRGDGVQPWPEVQLDTMARAAAALCQRHCWSTNRVISHAEWTSRKVDPRGINMNDFRARVTSFF